MSDAVGVFEHGRDNMQPEVYFLRYAFPCARVLVDFRKTLTEKEFQEMQTAVETGRQMDRTYLAEKFDHAIEGLRMVSDDIWNVNTIREYFWKRHEEHLSPDLPPIVSRLCVVKKGKLVKEVKGYFKADLGEGDVRVVSPLYKGASVGDTVMVHYGYAVEKVD